MSEVHALKTNLSAKFDDDVRKQTAETHHPITCREGCASCCYHPVLISIAEGILLYRWLSKNGKWTTALKRKLEDTSDLQVGTTFEVWLMSLIPCPLLTEDQKCSAYEARPFICRAYYATSDPYYCHPHRLGPHTEIVDRTEITDAFQKGQTKSLQRHQIQFAGMPLGMALLLAEKVCLEQIELEGTDFAVFREYADKG